MPTYEYECGSCGKIYEHYHASSAERDKAPPCPLCGGADAKRLMSAFAVSHLKSFGGGRTCCGSAEPSGAGCDTPGSCCSK
ncbi:MAG: zinc ribbon domain-containing protein [bacterium]